MKSEDRWVEYKKCQQYQSAYNEYESLKYYRMKESPLWHQEQFSLFEPNLL